MPRANSAVPKRRRRKKILLAARGYRGAKSKLFKTAKEAVEKGLQYAYRDRKARKRDFRKLWIIRINAAARLYGATYSKLIDGMARNNIEINRKMLAEIAVSDAATFEKIVKTATS